MSETIFLRVGTIDRIPLAAFIDSLRNFLLVLRDLDATISRNPLGNITWEVASLEKNSPSVVGVAPQPKRGRDDISEIVEEQLIENTKLLSSSGERNQYMSDTALARIENLAKRTPKIGAMGIYLNGTGAVRNEVNITESTLNNVRQLTGVKYSAYGSMVGNLDAITIHRGNEFRVWDDITKKPVRCKFAENNLDHVKDLLGKRVTVFGEVQSNSTGNPVSISVDNLSPAPKQKMPTIEEMSGFIKDFTAGKSLKEYMEELSNE